MITPPAVSLPLADRDGVVPHRPARRVLGVVLIGSFLLRVVLAWRGGQFFWPDEDRFVRSREAIDALLGARWDEATTILLGSSDHILFRWLGLIPAAMERLWFDIGGAAPTPGPAIWFGAVFGTLGIGLLWRIIRAETRDEVAATWGAVLYAGCGSGFYYSRHYLPYDAALAFMLLGWMRAVTRRGVWRDIEAGWWVGLGFLTYNAYWNVGAVVLAWHVLRPGDGGWAHRLGRATWGVLGLGLAIGGFIGLADLAGHDLLAHAREFSRTVDLGGFGRGWLTLVHYLAATEGILGVLVGWIAVIGLARAARDRTLDPGAGFLVVGLGLALTLIFFSDVLEWFAVSARMIRPVMIFACAGAGVVVASGLREWTRPGQRLGGALLALGVVASALGNFAGPLQLEFPREFERWARDEAARILAEDATAALELRHAFFLHRPEPLRAAVPRGDDVVREAPHPMNYAPYRFEGYTAEERADYEAGAFRMQLIRWRDQAPRRLEIADLRAAAAGSGELGLRVLLPSPLPVGRVDPLVVIGSPGRADVVGMRYGVSNRVTFIHDRWGESLHESGPVVVRPGELQYVALRLPPMRGHGSDGAAVIRWDDQEVELAGAWLPDAPRIRIAEDDIGASTVQDDFAGEIWGVEWREPGASPSRGWREIDAGWLGWPGLLEAEFQVTEPVPVGRWPVLFARRSWEQLELWALVEATGVGQLELVMRDRVLVRSEAVDLSAGVHQVRVALPIFTPGPELVPDVQRVPATYFQAATVFWDDRRVLRTELPELPPDRAVVLGRRARQAFAWSWGRNEVRAGVAATVEAPWVLARARQLDVAERPSWAWLSERGVTASFQAGAGEAEKGIEARLRLRLPAELAGQEPEPLLSTGVIDRGDVIYLRPERPGWYRIGHDHGGLSLLESEPVALSLGQHFTLDLTMRRTADGGGRLTAKIDGRVILDAPRSFHPMPESGWTPGANFIRAWSALREFSGEVEAVEMRGLGRF